MIPLPTTPGNHYWIVAGDETQVYSSARRTFVPVADGIYQAWLAASGLPTRTVSQAELWDTLATQFPGGLPVGNTTLRDRLRTQAQAFIDGASEKAELALRAVVLLELDEINRFANWGNELKTRMAAAANTVAGVKSAVAAMPTLPTYTTLQAKNAIKQKIADGLAD
jgi:hypothetical protein